MPLYYFNIRNGTQYTKDSCGTYLPDLGSVRRVALYRAKKILAAKGDAVVNAELEIADKVGVLVEAFFVLCCEEIKKCPFRANDLVVGGSERRSAIVWRAVMDVGLSVLE